MSIESALEQGRGIIVTREHRHLRNQFARAIAAGELVRLFPGVLVASNLSADPGIRARAALAWQPGHVLMGPAAALVTFWRDCPVDAIDLAGANTRLVPDGVRLHQVSVPYDLRVAWEAGQATNPALTVLDMAAMGRWDALCHGLRTGSVSLESLSWADATLPWRHGVSSRAECLLAASGNPWSVPELDLHQLYRSAGITGWVGNQPMICGGRRFIPDVAFRHARVIVEVDGRSHHDGPGSFESDRDRHNSFVADGWAVLHVTPRMIWNESRLVIAQTRAVVPGRWRD
ncbi:hypothetical protein GCM10009785_33220 [Brooklawnia cerclae]|uniref:DUF559 domain-containing protein n=1 Tax=Brooklawnia cerclae TaxID=349934 RepID=A0ABX0SGG0_9ACTN|nr:DUF559 domain-containing protein [Brooklawnia cerclae]NIH55762.1 hypothetical protein [Brooklawnia cerclae]